MWRFLLTRLGLRGKSHQTFPIYRLIDFTRPSKEHWAKFEGGDNYDAMFLVRGCIQRRDEILVRLRSGRVGRYQVFSCVPDFSGIGDCRIRCIAMGYWDVEKPMAIRLPKVPTQIKGLLGDGTRWLRSSSSEPSDISFGLADKTGEFWKVQCRAEACSRRTSSVCAGGNL